MKMQVILPKKDELFTGHDRDICNIRQSYSIALHVIDLKCFICGSSAPIFFLLQAKCSVIARDLGVNEGGTVLKQQAANECKA
jgi:hypothetical protein